jgi:transcriptional activator of cad operon
MNTHDFSPEGLRIGVWRIRAREGLVCRDGEERTLEPKVMDLLVLLASRPGEVVTHDEIFTALWPDTVVGDDTLARVVSKLRRALDDDAKAPRYIQTVAKRGYRLIGGADAEPTAAQPAQRRRLPVVVIAGAAVILALTIVAVWRMDQAPDANAALIARARDHYYQYTRAENESAIAIYERVLAAEPDNAEASAGLATALVQRALRWPNAPGEKDFTRTTLGEALADGRLDTPQSRAWLERALMLADAAAQRAPNDAFVQQARGLALAASRRFDTAALAYERAVAVDRDAWGALINLGDLADIRGAPEEALPYYERAYAAMERVYAEEAQRVRPWQGALGVLIAERHAARGEMDEAERWYRLVLAEAPRHEGAVVGLAALLNQKGDAAGAAQLCAELIRSTGANAACDAMR